MTQLDNLHRVLRKSERMLPAHRLAVKPNYYNHWRDILERLLLFFALLT